LEEEVPREGENDGRSGGGERVLGIFKETDKKEKAWEASEEGKKGCENVLGNVFRSVPFVDMHGAVKKRECRFAVQGFFINNE
jgi:hypothetical protein